MMGAVHRLGVVECVIVTRNMGEVQSSCTVECASRLRSMESSNRWTRVRIRFGRVYLIEGKC